MSLRSIRICASLIALPSDPFTSPSIAEIWAQAAPVNKTEPHKRTATERNLVSMGILQQTSGSRILRQIARQCYRLKGVTRYIMCSHKSSIHDRSRLCFAEEDCI